MSAKKEEQYCECCGASMTQNKQGLTRSLVKILIKFRRAMLDSENPEFNQIHPQKDVEFTQNEYNNFQKLRYFGLVAKCRDENGDRISGYWLLTRNGNRFCKGELKMPKYVMTFRNKIVSKSDEKIDVKEALKSEEFPYFQKDFKFDLADVMDIDVLPPPVNGDIDEDMVQTFLSFD